MAIDICQPRICISHSKSISVWLLESYPDSTVGGAYLELLDIPRESILPPESGYVFLQFLFVPGLAVTCNWPFLVFAARVKRTVLKYWPDAKAVQAAIVGGLTGLLIPYVFLYVVLPVDVIANRDVIRGAGASFLVPFAWVVGGLLAYFGLRIGPVVVSKRSPD